MPDQRLKVIDGDNARAATEYYLNRIEALDKPDLNAIIALNPDALSSAAALDQEYRNKGSRGPLHGAPVLLKDNIDTNDRMSTSAGSLALADSIAARDAFIVTKLRAAGAVILGKTNLSEWANFRSTRSTSGWSSRGGQTRNAYAPERTPLGSSSGSAVAVAAGFCAAALGTETDGSITYPAAANSIVGLKPTLGLISRSGIIPIAHSQDTAGPMARTVTDAAILLGALTGIDERDPVTKTQQGLAYDDYPRFLDPQGLKGAKIGIARNFFGADHRVDQLIETAIAAMNSAGANIIDPITITGLDELRELELEVLYHEFKADLNDYLAALNPAVPVHSLAELIAFNEQHHDRVMPYFGQERFLLAQAKGPLNSPAYQQALSDCRRLARSQGLDAVLGQHDLDALIAPTLGLPWPIDPTTGDRGSMGCSTLAAVAGYPHITVPAGYVDGLPVGLSFFAGAFQEPTLLKLAFAFEQMLPVRRPPPLNP